MVTKKDTVINNTMKKFMDFIQESTSIHGDNSQYIGEIKLL